MFLVHDQNADNLVFTFIDPRADRCEEDVREGVRLEYDEDADHAWPTGEDRPEACVGRDRNDDTHFKVFRSSRDLSAAGFELENGNVVLVPSWSDYVRLRLTPPSPDQVDEELWYDYLDELDENVRRHNETSESDGPESDRIADVAKWVAKRHFVADIGVREIWYLPHGSPEEQIRLLEVNDRSGSNDEDVIPVDFGLAVGSTSYRLVIADVTSSQLQALRQDPSGLPPGWSFESAIVWRRRSA